MVLNDMPIKTYSMSDEGTRLSHLMDLHDLWSAALQILMSRERKDENTEIAILEYALKLLNVHIMHDYVLTPYAEEIDKLPKDPKSIE